MNCCPHCGSKKFESECEEIKDPYTFQTVAYKNTCKQCGQQSVYVEATDEQITEEQWQLSQ